MQTKKLGSSRSMGITSLLCANLALGQVGDETDILVQKRKDNIAARRFFRKFLKVQLAAPIKIVTDKLS
jgi:transposase-like protein